MPVLSKYTKQRIVALRNKGLSNSELVYELKREGIDTTPQSARRFYKRYLQDGTIARRQGSGRPSLLTDSVLAMVEELMRTDDETTATQIHAYLLHRGQEISLPTIIRGRRFLGWTFRGTAYCQLIRDVNKQKRLEWAQQHLHDDFRNVIWSDETTVQLESHKKRCCASSTETQTQSKCISGLELVGKVQRMSVYLRGE